MQGIDARRGMSSGSGISRAIWVCSTKTQCSWWSDSPVPAGFGTFGQLSVPA